MNAGTLYWSARRCSAADAVAATPGELIVLAAMPAEFTVAARRDGTLVAPDHHAWTVPNACFQLTAFDRERELRWLADGDDGTAVWVAESSELLPAPVSGTLGYVERLSQRFVLWGRPEPGEPPGVFSTWSQARIGLAHYPCPPGADSTDRAVLDTVEYVTVDDHGNAAVADARLTAISTDRGTAR